MLGHRSSVRGVILGLFAGMGSAWAGPPAYDIIDLGTLGGSSSVALAVNEVGQVAGSADTPQGLRHAYIWDPHTGEMTDLGTLPPWHQSGAWDVNNAGEVVGILTTTGNGGNGFLWRDGVMINLGDLGSPDVNAFGVNDATQVVGKARVGVTEVHAFLWENGVMTDIPNTLGGSNSGATDINNAGQIVGSADTAAVSGAPVLWEGGTMTDLGTLGGEMGWASSINDSTQIVGSSERIPGERIFHAFLWDDGEMIDLGALLGFSSSRAEAINNNGQILIGPFLYDSVTGDVADLEDRIPADSGWYDLSPRGLNDAGQVVGAGTINGRRHAFLMTPIPIPTVSVWGMIVMTLLLVAVGAIVIRRGPRRGESFVTHKG